MKSFVLFSLGALLFASCGLKGSGEAEKQPSLMTVEFKGEADSTITNPKGKMKLFAVPENVADVEATLLDEVDFEAATIPFSVEFNIPVDHTSLIKPAINEGDKVKYYVAMDWDSNGDGKVDSTDVLIDFDRQFPNVDVTQLHQEVFLK